MFIVYCFLLFGGGVGIATPGEGVRGGGNGGGGDNLVGISDEAGGVCRSELKGWAPSAVNGCPLGSNGADSMAFWTAPRASSTVDVLVGGGVELVVTSFSRPSSRSSGRGEPLNGSSGTVL